MNFYLNELSLKKQATSERDAIVWVREFAKICSILKEKYELRRIFINPEFYYAELYSNFPMGKILHDKVVKQRMRNLRQLFFTVDYPERYNPDDYVINNDNAIGLGLAHYNDLFGLSFTSDDIWKVANIEFDNKEIAKNISLETHISIHKIILDRKLSEQLRIPENYNFEENPLPFADKSEKKLNVKNELDRIGKLSRDKKRAEYKLLGTKIAEFNQWEYDEAVSKLNTNSGQLRTIFKKGEGSKTYYLSIDIENGPFELFKRKNVREAEHLGEFSSITGDINEKGQSQKKHYPLKLKR